VDGAGILLLIVFFAMIAVLSGTGRSRQDLLLRKQSDSRVNDSIYKSIRTDATGMLICRRCGAESPEHTGSCPRCGASL
jgi:uncharacterized paraquat-inducible protein A